MALELPVAYEVCMKESLLAQGLRDACPPGDPRVMIADETRLEEALQGDLPVVLVTEDPLAWMGIAKICAYVSPYCTWEDIHLALLVGLHGGTWVSRQKDEVRERMTRWSELRKEIFHLALRGYTAKEIGKRVYASEKTVKNHLTRIYRAFDVKNRAELLAVVYGFRRAEAAAR
ncbi:MAG: hypothetical protein KM310_00220 [Clostridiales bacterium]|nr:hypothetical protein [Clostridiales bacterium]